MNLMHSHMNMCLWNHPWLYEFIYWIQQD